MAVSSILDKQEDSLETEGLAVVSSSRKKSKERVDFPCCPYCILLVQFVF
jgi:hypothetical protein